MGTNTVARPQGGDTNLANVVGVGHVHGYVSAGIAVLGPSLQTGLFHL